MEDLNVGFSLQVAPKLATPTTPGASIIKTFYTYNLQMFQMSYNVCFWPAFQA